uniref:Uncharacterized protein n=1 Tax=Zea mays TaxID=4577 RepID=B6SNS2_MAIZE|nr:hypothetical protein [Zea mays]
MCRRRPILLRDAAASAALLPAPLHGRVQVDRSPPRRLPPRTAPKNALGYFFLDLPFGFKYVSLMP